MLATNGKASETVNLIGKIECRNSSKKIKVKLKSLKESQFAV